MAEHAMPWWMGYFLISPIRKIRHNPNEILTPYVKEGMTILEIGPGMGFFSLPLAEIVGSKGKIISVELQEQMLIHLRKRIAKKGYSERFELRKCSPDSLKIDDIKEKIDFALVFAVAHEVNSKEKFFAEIEPTLKPGAKLLLADPTGHETKEGFQKSLSIAQGLGMNLLGDLKIANSYGALLEK